jgi:hypothetical protein
MSIAIESADLAKDPDDLSKEETHARIIRLGFGGDRKRYDLFCEKLREGLPQGTEVALRGSVITNERWKDGEPFDADGQSTSDLDVTLIGDDVRKCWNEDAYYIPGLHTKPLCDKDPDIAPQLKCLREELQQIAGRPVCFQATSNIVLFARDVLFDQPYFKIIEAG